MKNKTTVLVVGGMNSGKIAALTAMQCAGLVHLVEYPSDESSEFAQTDKVTIDESKTLLLKNRDIQFNYVKSYRPNPSNQKWYNQFQNKRRKR